MSDPLPMLNDDTPPLGFEHSDRVMLDNRIDVVEADLNVVEAELKTFVQERRDQAYAFYLTRMIPLEVRVARADARSWFALGMVVAVLAIVIALHR